MFRRRYIRLFVSSTFEDMQVERDLLQTRVFPSIQQYCAERGWQFDGIDLRWGISAEAGLNQQTMSICLDELQECQNVSPRPNFLVLTGQRYGWIPLPESLSTEEYEDILRFAPENYSGLFNAWYLFDSNSLPDGKYVLKARTAEGDVDYCDNDVYNVMVYQPLRRLFTEYSRFRGDSAAAVRFMTSATEQEIIKGALAVEDSTRHIVVFDRTLKDIPKEHESRYMERGRWFDFSADTPARRLKELKRQLRNSAGIYIEETVTFEEHDSAEYAERFVRSITEAVTGIVAREIDQYNRIPQHEIDSQMSWALAGKMVKGILPFEKCLEVNGEWMSPGEWLMAGDVSYYLVQGESCGRTTLLSHMALQLRQKGADVILRHVRYNDGIHSGMSMLRSIWEELVSIYPSESEFSTFCFKRHLSRLRVTRPLYIVVDDMLLPEECEDILDLAWLPDSLPGNVHLIASCTADPKIAFSSIARLNLMHRHGIIDIFANGMARRGRRLTGRQGNYVITNASFIPGITMSDICNMVTLYDDVRSFEEIEIWDPFDKIGKSRALAHVIHKMSYKRHYGKLPIILFLNFDILRFGQSIGEICRMIPKTEYWKEFLQSNQYQKLCTTQLPTAVAIRTLKGMEHLLTTNYFADQYLYSKNFRTSFIDEICWLDSSAERRPKLVDFLLKFYLDEFSGVRNPHALIEIIHLASMSRDRWERLLSVDMIVQIFRMKIEDYVVRYYENAASSISSQYKTLLYNVKNYLEIKERNNVHDMDPVQIAEQLSAEYAPGTVVRDSFDRYMHGQKNRLQYMYNTLGITEAEHHLITHLHRGIEAGRGLCHVVNGIAVWQEAVGGHIYTCRLSSCSLRQRLKVEKPRCFDIVDNKLFVVAENGIYVWQLNMDTSFASSDPIWHKDRRIGDGQADQVRAARLSDGCYMLYCRCGQELHKICVRFNSSILAIIGTPLTYKETTNLIGALHGGKWIATRYLTREDRNIIAHFHVYDISQSKTVASWSFKSNDIWSKASTGGDTLAFIVGTQDLFYIDFSQEQPRLQSVRVSVSWGHAPCYFVHTSEDGSSVLVLSGDKRLVKLDVRTGILTYQMSLFSEVSSVVASHDNMAALWNNYEVNDYYNKLINLGNIGCQHDYLPPSLYSLSADARGETLVSSYGYFAQFSAESAWVHRVTKHGVSQSLEDDSAFMDRLQAGWARFPYAKATAITADGSMYAYSRGNHIFLVDTRTGNKRHLHFDSPESSLENVSSMLFSQDNKALIAFMTDYPEPFNVEANGDRSAYYIFDLTDLDKETPVECKVLYEKTDRDRTIYLEKASLSPDGRIVYLMDSLLSTARAIDLKDGFISIRPLSTEGRKDNRYTLPPDGGVKFFPDSGIRAYSMDHRIAFIKTAGGKRYLVCDKMQLDVSMFSRPKAIQWCADCLHLFIIFEKSCVLINTSGGLRIIQRWSDVSISDEHENYFFGCGMGNVYMPYAKGIIYYNGVKIVRLEPSGGYMINERAVAWAVPIYDVIQKKYGEPSVKCPLCGHLFKYEGEGGECICPGCGKPLTIKK